MNTNAILPLFFSGVYITTKELLGISKSLGFEQPSKSRELLLKNLVTHAESECSMKMLYSKLNDLIESKVQKYRELEESFDIDDVSRVWIEKALITQKVLKKYIGK
jgi:hypothetical protein